MELYEIIRSNYDIEPIIKIEKTKNGSGNTYFIETIGEKYIAKVNERMDFVYVYDKVQNILKQMDFLQSSIIKSNNGEIMTSEGIVLYQVIDGENYTTLSKNQSKNAIKYIREYNKALRLVPFNNEELEIKNHWDKAKSMYFIINDFPNYLNALEIGIENKKNIYDVISILSNNMTKVIEAKKQLIHSDLGADNFIFKKDKVISVIDFTPEYNHELYSLCQFIYWNYLWNAENINIEAIDNYFRLYNFDDNFNTEKELFNLMLLNSALYRLAGPLIDSFNRSIKDYSRFKKRFFILSELLRNYKYSLRMGEMQW